MEALGGKGGKGYGVSYKGSTRPVFNVAIIILHKQMTEQLHAEVDVKFMKKRRRREGAQNLLLG